MNGSTTARIIKTDDYVNGVVVSRDAMSVNVLYEVRCNDNIIAKIKIMLIILILRLEVVWV